MQERLRPAGNISRLHFDCSPVKPVRMRKGAGDPDTRLRPAGEGVLLIVRTRNGKIEDLDAAARSIENRLDSTGRPALMTRADKIRRNAGMRLNPTAQLVPSQ